MSIKLLFDSATPKKKLRKELKPPPLGKDQYNDVEYLKDCFAGEVGEDTLRVRLIRTVPVPAYRITVLRMYKGTHAIKCKDERTAMLQPGLYVLNQWWAEKQIDGFVFTPSLKGEDNGNS